MSRAAHLHAQQKRNIAAHRVGKAELGSGKVFRGKASAKKSSPGLAQAWLSKVKPRQSLQPDSLLSKGLESKVTQRQSCAGHHTAEAEEGEPLHRMRSEGEANHGEATAKRVTAEAERSRTRRGSGEARHVEAWELRFHAKRRQGTAMQGSGVAMNSLSQQWQRRAKQGKATQRRSKASPPDADALIRYALFAKEKHQNKQNQKNKRRKKS